VRVIDALQLPEVLDGSMWMALSLADGGWTMAPPDLQLDGHTIAVDPKRKRMYWCDGVYDPNAVAPSHFGGEAMLTLPRLLGQCTLVPAKKES
jgi:hypothetical protein